MLKDIEHPEELNEQDIGSGLAICNKIIAQSGGKMDVISAGKDNGVTFRFTMKMEKIEEDLEEIEQTVSNQLPLIYDPDASYSPSVSESATEILIRANRHSKGAQLNQGSPQVRSQMIQTESERISETPRLDKQSFLTEHHDLDAQSDLSLVFD